MKAALSATEWTGITTMKNNFGYLLGEGFKSTFKHGFMSFAAVCITVACLVIINSFLLISYNLNIIVGDMQEKTRIVAVVDDSLSQAEAKSVGSEINMIDNVSRAEFISREQALENFGSYFENSDELFAGLDADTMRDQYEIVLVDNEKISTTKEQIESIPGVYKVEANIEEANAMVTVRNVLYIASVAITAVLFIVSLIIISNTIKLAMMDRKEEIGIMKMVGATNGFIRLPFLVEGFVLGLFGSVFSFFIEWGLYEALRNAIMGTGIQVITFVSFAEIWIPMAIICVIAGFVIGIFGSLMSIRRFLKV